MPEDPNEGMDINLDEGTYFDFDKLEDDQPITEEFDYEL